MPFIAWRLFIPLVICAAWAVGASLLALSIQGPSAENSGAPPSVDNLERAVRAGNLAEIKSLLLSGADVNGRDPLGGTALLEAAWAGNTDVVRLLLKHGADVNAVHREAGSTALQYAVLKSKPEIVEMLLAAGADVNRLYRNGQTIVHLAAARNDPEVLDKLFSFHAPLDLPDLNGNTPLDEAVLHDRRASVECLLAHGANVNRLRPSDGRGPIHEASTKGYSDLIPLLIQAGANPAQRDRFAQTPLDLALAYKNGSVVSILLKTGASLSESQLAAETAMQTAAVKGQTEIVQILLQSGFDVNRPTASGSTYLHDAALKNQVRVARLLLQAGANREARNGSGGTPLHDAALGGSVDVINVLLDSGAQIDARDAEAAATPLMLAASLDRIAAVELLLKRGANPRLLDSQRHSALSRARQNENPAMVRLLQSAVANP